MSKKITFSIDQDRDYQTFKHIFSKRRSDSHGAKILFVEYLNIFQMTLNNLDIFTEEEIFCMVDMFSDGAGYTVHFPHGSSPIQIFMSELGEYFKSKHSPGKKVPEDFRKKLENLSEMDIYVLCRVINLEWNKHLDDPSAVFLCCLHKFLIPELLNEYLVEHVDDEESES